MEPDTQAIKLSSSLVDEIRKLRKEKSLHARVTTDLVDAVHKLFPDWVCVAEIAQTPGGRNDAVLFESGGNSICFEVFATRAQVDRDLLLLHNSSAKNKIAILIDREVDASIAEAFYRKQPHKPYPVIWISDVMDTKRRSYLELKLTQFVLGSRLSEYVAISRQLAQAAQERTLWAWQSEGIDIYSSDAKDKASFGAVLSLLTEDTLIIVTAQKIPIDWADNRDIYNWDWELMIVFWDRVQNLLFIHSSTNKGEFKKLAQAVAGDDAELIREQVVFRCFEGMNRLRFQNVGLTKQFGRLIRYEGRMGSDVELGLSEVQKKNTKKTVLFGTGYRDGRKVTFGASRKGRMWSFATANVEALIKWCRLVGTKVLDDAIDPDEILKGTLEAEIISERPTVMPIGIDWPEDVYKELETAYTFVLSDRREAQLFETDITLKDPSERGDLSFQLTAESLHLEFKLILFEDDGYKDYRFEAPAGQIAYVKHKSSLIPLEEFFYRDSPIIWFANGANLEGNAYTPLKTKYPPYDRNKIITWDWTGVNLKVESQGVAKQKDSIQYRMIQTLLAGNYDVIFDDDDPGEAADVVAIKVSEESDKQKWIDVEFYHCKFSKETPGGRIKDLYEVCGQAQKSIRWMERHDKNVELFTHLLRREPKKGKRRNATRYEKGDQDELIRIRQMSEIWPVRLKIFVVQPGVSKEKVSKDQLELLSVTENHLLETFILPFTLIASA